MKGLLEKKFIISFFAFWVIALVLSSCSVLRPYVYTGNYYSSQYHVLRTVKPGYTEFGIASWYGPKFQGRRTANGEVYDMYAHTAASKTLPFNTVVKVINLNNGRSTIVRINDRGPFVKNRIIDLSYAAAKDLGMIGSGTAPVKIIVLGRSSSLNDFENTNVVRKPVVDQLDKITINTNIGANLDINTSFGNFAIQVGSFRNLLNALRLRDKLLKNFNNVYIEKKIIDGDVFYRVLIGSFDTEEEAKRFALNNLASFAFNYCIIKK